ncbi:hypothetical protein [Nocardia sp. NPDC005998]|uniref:hypothetical protein n=1 Tax=Nocardia sp. NPDC005998 TaxID=3156894 RepID=UPI0033BFB189
MRQEPDRKDGIPCGIDLDAADENGDPAPYAWITGIAKPLESRSRQDLAGHMVDATGGEIT